MTELQFFLESHPTAEMVDEFFINIQRKWRMQDRLKAFDLLLEYAGKQSADVAATLHNGYNLHMENKASANALTQLAKIASIPYDTVIDPKYLNDLGLANEDFVTACDTMLDFLCACYGDIARAPFEWGYPTSHKKIQSVDGGWHCRFRHMLSQLFWQGEFDGSDLLVNKAAFINKQYKSSTKETLQMLDGITNMGLIVEDFDNRHSRHFRVSFPDNADMLKILTQFFTDTESQKCRRCWDDCSHIGQCYWNYPITRNTVFSYRFFEDRRTQSHETEFLIVLDYAPEILREIHFWLYEEVKKYGFDFDPYYATSYGNMLYRKGGWGSKNFPLIGMYDSEGDRLQNCEYAAHAEFKKNAALVMERFPNAVNNDGLFTFAEPTIEEAKEIIEMWKSTRL